ncbi:hypothetical protein LWU68_12145 [Enterobacter cloacae]|uniref:hypothetical protein n=1 Tax=Enterobacter cloacae TaxID=550 RepID=UPI001E3A293E|nr:hypothetical protein [Enterobacter cloacae]MCE1397655.1 hypothetical protein [Enterobacter cloacae]
MLLTYVERGQDNFDWLARVAGVDAPYIFWFHCQSNGTAQLITKSSNCAAGSSIGNVLSELPDGTRIKAEEI